MSEVDWKLSEEEQRRIIEHTGVLRRKGARPSQVRPGKTAPLIRQVTPPRDDLDDEDEAEQLPEEPESLADELFTDFLWLVIFTFLFVGLSVPHQWL
jgi:hypothetical protein